MPTDGQLSRNVLSPTWRLRVQNQRVQGWFSEASHVHGCLLNTGTFRVLGARASTYEFQPTESWQSHDLSSREHVSNRLMGGYLVLLHMGPPSVAIPGTSVPHCPGGEDLGGSSGMEGAGAAGEVAGLAWEGGGRSSRRSCPQHTHKLQDVT